MTTLDNQQFIYDNQDNPDYAEVEECLKETLIEEHEKDIRSDIDRAVGAFMDYMEHANRNEERNRPINIVVNAATRWKAEEIYDASS